VASIMFKSNIKQVMRTVEGWVNKLEPTIKDPQVMDAGVKHLGRAIDEQFKAEGSATMGSGKWAPLSKMTQDVRASRGYNPTRPVLQQSGTLRAVAAGSLKSWGAGQGSVSTRGPGIAMVASTRPLEFNATISGKKVGNHYGEKTLASFYPEGNQRGGDSSSIPARPFFGLTNVGVLLAKDAMMDKITIDWNAKSTKSKRK
jgi:hypothetical protein